MPDNSRIILVVIILAFAIRLFGITDAPIERSHNWRQSFTAMVARNFDHTDIIHPEVDLEGGKPVAMEFPIFSYLIHILNAIFGSAYWYGRIINLIVSSLGLYFFFKLIQLFFEEKIALYSTIILTFSIFFSFSRKIMPDTFSISLTIIGIYLIAFYIYNTRHSLILLTAGSFFISIGLLSKIPALTMLAFFAPIVFDTKLSFQLKLKGILLGIIPAFIVAYFWYGIIVPGQLKNGAMQLYFPVNFTNGIKLLTEHLDGVFEKFYFSALSSYVLFLIFTSGIVFLFIRKERTLILILLSSSFGFFFFMLKASNFFYFHNYYIIPFVPVMAVICGYAISELSKLNKGLAILVMIVGLSESILNQQHGFFIPVEEKYKLSLTEIVDKYIPSSRKVVLNTGPNPQELFFCNRKGWVLDEPKFIDRKLIQKETQENSIVIIDRHKETPYEENDFSIIFQNIDFLLLELKAE